MGPECQQQVGHLGKDASERNRVSIQNCLELAEAEGWAWEQGLSLKPQQVAPLPCQPPRTRAGLCQGRATWHI